MMKRKAWQIAVLTLLIGVLLLLSACGKPKGEEQFSSSSTETGAEEVPAAAEIPLAGEYMIDITNLGMGLQFYLRIDEDNTFVLSPSREFMSDRGSGKIGELEGTYVMIYSDSTPENPKTATFEREGHNLVFRSTLPYGSANIMYELQDEENPEVVHRLMALKLIYEEYWGPFLASVEVDGVQYDYELNLAAGARYSFHSYLDGVEVYHETGTFRADGALLVCISDDGEETAGSVNQDGEWLLEFRPAAGKERIATTFKHATSADQAGKWYGQTAGGELAVLELDAFGDYVYAAGEYSEEGTFSARSSLIRLWPVLGEYREYSKTPYTLEAVFGSDEVLLYSEQIIGTFAGATMASEAYTAQLEITVSGEFTLLIVDEENGVELLNEAGSFQVVAGPMNYQLALEAEGAVRVVDIWPTGLVTTINIDSTDYRFLLTKN